MSRNVILPRWWVALGLGAFLSISAGRAAELSVNDVVMLSGATAEAVVVGEVNEEETYGVNIVLEIVPQAGATGTVEFTPAPPVDIVALGDPWPEAGVFSAYDTDLAGSPTMNGSVDDNGSFIPEAVTFSGALAGFPVVASADASGVWDVRLSTSEEDSSWEGLVTTLTAGTITVEAAEPPTVPPHPDDEPKNRCISFEPNNDGVEVAFRVTMTSSTYFPASVGELGWIGESGASEVSRVTSAPFFTDAWPVVVHVCDCEIVPVATYAVRATWNGAAFSEPLTLGTIAEPAPKKWGDVVGSFTGTEWTGPNGVVNMDDVMAAVQRFQQLETAPPLTWVDVDPEEPNTVLNFTDIMRITQGFKGEAYPFSDPLFCP